MAYHIRKDELPHAGTSHRFEGAEFGGADVSFFWTDAPPGTGPKLHRHPYPEVFVILEGQVTFTVGDETIEAVAGDVVIVPAGQPHRFVNIGPGRSRHLDLHPSDQMSTEWIEEGG